MQDLCGNNSPGRYIEIISISTLKFFALNMRYAIYLYSLLLLHLQESFLLIAFKGVNLLNSLSEGDTVSSITFAFGNFDNRLCLDLSIPQCRIPFTMS